MKEGGGGGCGRSMSEENVNSDRFIEYMFRSILFEAKVRILSEDMASPQKIYFKKIVLLWLS